MNVERVRQDATESTRGTIYQLCVAVEKCYELREGQRLLIEELGDITIEGDQQVEVKQYGDRLTDGHPNFWNTLRNWLDDSFDPNPYSVLILHTTQQFGTTALIRNWNDQGKDGRLEALIEINQKFEEYYQRRRNENPDRNPSEVLKCQRSVLDPAKRARLEMILEKTWIEAGAQELPAKYRELQRQHMRGVLASKRDDYLNALIGFVCRADKRAGERWEITFEDFEAKLTALTSMYCSETRQFPRKFFHHSTVAQDWELWENLFVRKIRDIRYDEVIRDAIHDYEATMLTLHEELRYYGIDDEDLVGYVGDLVKRFQASYRSACRRCSDEASVVEASQNLYDDTTGSPAPPVPSFGDTPDGFRNGLLHMKMDDDTSGLQWRVRSRERRAQLP